MGAEAFGRCGPTGVVRARLHWSKITMFDSNGRLLWPSIVVAERMQSGAARGLALCTSCRLQLQLPAHTIVDVGRHVRSIRFEEAGSGFAIACAQCSGSRLMFDGNLQ